MNTKLIECGNWVNKICNLPLPPNKIEQEQFYFEGLPLIGIQLESGQMIRVWNKYTLGIFTLDKLKQLYKILQEKRQ